MVTRLTSYTKQRYVCNSTDDQSGLDFHNGDTEYLMDLQQEIIYSEDNNQWYPVPAAGGGGGAGTGYVELGSGTYTQASDLTNTYMEIPVSLSMPGTAKNIIIKKTSDLSATAYTRIWGKAYVEWDSTYMTMNQLQYHKTDDTNDYSWGQSNGITGVIIDSFENPTYVRLYPYSSTYRIKAGQYNWYIMGVKA